jgi:hypothetical protein
VNDQYATSLAVDPSGNLIVAGYFSGTVNFGGANLTSTGDTDIFVAKFSPAGVHQWSQRFGGLFADQALSVAVNASGDVIVAGYFEGTVDFGGGSLVSSGLADIFVRVVPAESTNGAGARRRLRSNRPIGGGRMGTW